MEHDKFCTKGERILGKKAPYHPPRKSPASGPLQPWRWGGGLVFEIPLSVKGARDDSASESDVGGRRARVCVRRVRGCAGLGACVAAYLFSSLSSLSLSLSRSRFLARVKERGGGARACVRVCVCGCACTFARSPARMHVRFFVRLGVHVVWSTCCNAYMHAARYASGLQDCQSCAGERARASEGSGEAMLVA